MHKNKHAFTLIELLVVVLIIGVLSAIALPQYQKAVNRAHSAEALTTARSIADSMNRYYLANGSYKDIEASSLDIQAPILNHWKYCQVGTGCHSDMEEGTRNNHTPYVSVTGSLPSEATVYLTNPYDINLKINVSDGKNVTMSCEGSFGYECKDFLPCVSITYKNTFDPAQGKVVSKASGCTL